MAGRITIAPPEELQQRVDAHRAFLGFAPEASLASIYTELAIEGFRARWRRAKEAEMARAYETRAQDPGYRADNRAEFELALGDGLLH